MPSEAPAGGIVDLSGFSGAPHRRADVCVIGSGAGGAVVAKELAEAGARVVLLEEGAHHDAAAFTARPRDMLPRLYRDAAQHATIGRPPILLPLGRAVGGTTLVNSGTCFRTPDRVLARWRDEFGLTASRPASWRRTSSASRRRSTSCPCRRSWRAPTRTSPSAAPTRSAGRATSCAATCAAASARACARTAARRTPSSTSASPTSRRPTRRARRRTPASPRGGSGAASRPRPPPAAGSRVEAPRVVVAAGAIHTPGAARPQPARQPQPRPQPLAPPRHRRVGGDGRGRRHGARRPAVLLRRRVRRRRDHARGHRRAARLRRDGPARRRRAPPRADGRLPQRWPSSG